jgi:hypothetical protein
MSAYLTAELRQQLLEADDRVVSAVLEQPIGIDEANRQVLPNAWVDWANELVQKRTDVDMAMLEAFGKRMWSGDFVLSVSRDFVRSCHTPLLVLPGLDLAHPTAIGREIASLAPHAELLEPWKEPADLIPQTVERIRRFLRSPLWPNAAHVERTLVRFCLCSTLPTQAVLHEKYEQYCS